MAWRGWGRIWAARGGLELVAEDGGEGVFAGDVVFPHALDSGAGGGGSTFGHVGDLDDGG